MAFGDLSAYLDPTGGTCPQTPWAISPQMRIAGAATSSSSLMVMVVFVVILVMAPVVVVVVVVVAMSLI